MTSRVSRRTFLDGLAVGAAGLAVGTTAVFKDADENKFVLSSR